MLIFLGLYKTNNNQYLFVYKYNNDNVNETHTGFKFSHHPLHSKTEPTFCCINTMWCFKPGLLLLLFEKANLKACLLIPQVAKINQTAAQRRETHVLVMVVSMVSCYLLCWMPYGVMALLGTFSAGITSPTANVVSSLLAKSSTVLNPIIYVLFNNQVCACISVFVWYFFIAMSIWRLLPVLQVLYSISKKRSRTSSSSYP